MNITTITITRGLTINLQNYESTRLDVQMTADVALDADQLQATINLHNLVLDEMERELMDLDIPESIKLSHVAMLRTSR